MEKYVVEKRQARGGVIPMQVQRPQMDEVAVTQFMQKQYEEAKSQKIKMRQHSVDVKNKACIKRYVNSEISYALGMKEEFGQNYTYEV